MWIYGKIKELRMKVALQYTIHVHKNTKTIHTPSSVIIRHISMSLFMVPKPLIVDPTIYSPQSTENRTVIDKDSPR